MLRKFFRRLPGEPVISGREQPSNERIEPFGGRERAPADRWRALATLQALSLVAEGGVYLGCGAAGPVLAPAEHGVLVLGPPRSGKTSSLVVPNVLAASGAVLSASTKRDVLEATAWARQQNGPCLLWDPSGSVVAPPGVQRIGWSPLTRAADFEAALLVSRAMTETARPARRRGDEDHWSERAQTL